MSVQPEPGRGELAAWVFSLRSPARKYRARPFGWAGGGGWVRQACVSGGPVGAMGAAAARVFGQIGRRGAGGATGRGDAAGRSGARGVVVRGVGRLKPRWLLREGEPSVNERGMRSEWRALTLLPSSFHLIAAVGPSLLSHHSGGGKSHAWDHTFFFRPCTYFHFFLYSGDGEKNSSKENPEGQRG